MQMCLAQRGHFRSAGVPPKRALVEFKVTSDALLPVGTQLDATHFVPGQYVDVCAKRYRLAGMGEGGGGGLVSQTGVISHIHEQRIQSSIIVSLLHSEDSFFFLLQIRGRSSYFQKALLTSPISLPPFPPSQHR